jgi:hypothetical protein
MESCIAETQTLDPYTDFDQKYRPCIWPENAVIHTLILTLPYNP